MTIDLDAIKQAVLNKSVYELTSYNSTREVDEYYDDVFSVFLKECDLQDLQTAMSYCLRELIGNACKANIKRVYFENKHLDINDKKQYSDGMITFKTETTVMADFYREQVEKKQYYIKMSLQNRDDDVVVEIKNNAILTDIEKERIQERISKSRKYNSMEEALEDIDRTEGSGLGIIIINLTLKRLGFDRDSFTIECNEKETVARMVFEKINEL